MTDDFQHLLNDSKEYLQLRYGILKTELSQHLGEIIALSVVVLIGALLAVGALLYLGAALATAIAPYVGGMAIALCITAAALLFIFAVLYLLRNILFTKPLARAIAKILGIDPNNVGSEEKLQCALRQQQKTVQLQGELCKARLQTQLNEATNKIGWQLVWTLIRKLFK